MKEIGGDHKPIIYFEGKEKGIVLNKTNATAIATIYGDDTDDWTGGEIILYSAWVDFQGKQVEAIRIRVPPRKPAPRAAAQAEPAARQNDGPQSRDDDIQF